MYTVVPSAAVAAAARRWWTRRGRGRGGAGRVPERHAAEAATRCAPRPPRRRLRQPLPSARSPARSTPPPPPTFDVVALNAATGEVLWTYSYLPSNDAKPCCGRVNRGLAILGNTLYMGTTDAHLIAIDAKTGKLRGTPSRGRQGRLRDHARAADRQG